MRDVGQDVPERPTVSLHVAPPAPLPSADATPRAASKATCNVQNDLDVDAQEPAQGPGSDAGGPSEGKREAGCHRDPGKPPVGIAAVFAAAAATPSGDGSSGGGKPQSKKVDCAPAATQPPAPLHGKVSTTKVPARVCMKLQLRTLAPPPRSQAALVLDQDNNASSSSGSAGSDSGRLGGDDDYSACCWGDLVSVEYEGTTFYGRVVGGVVGRGGWFTVDFSLSPGKWDLFDYRSDELELVVGDDEGVRAKAPQVRQPPQSVVPLPNRDGVMPKTKQADSGSGASSKKGAGKNPVAAPAPAPAPDAPKGPLVTQEERKAMLFKRLQEHKLRRQKAIQLQHKLELKSPSPDCVWS